MNPFNKMYQYINILSLDVVAGSVISSLFFGRIFNVRVSVYALGALALTVWIIYTIDHLRDALIIPNLASTDRHRFHQRNFTMMAVMLLLVILGDCVLVRFLPAHVSISGFFLGLSVGVYLLFQRYLKFLKEMFVACLYTGGILLPSVAVSGWDLPPLHYALICQFFLTALINLLLFSLFDYEPDRHHKQQSFVTSFGRSSTRNAILILAFLNILGCLWMISSNGRSAFILMAMNLMLLAILVFKKKLVPHNYYRIVGDAIFFIPIFYLL